MGASLACKARECSATRVKYHETDEEHGTSYAKGCVPPGQGCECEREFWV